MRDKRDTCTEISDLSGLKPGLDRSQIVDDAKLLSLLSEHNNTLTSHCSPSSVADAIDHIAERIMAKAAEQATRVVDGEADRTKK